MEFKDIIPLWNLVDPLTVTQAAALIAGVNPNSVHFEPDGRAWFENETGYTESQEISWVQTALVALQNAALAGKLKVKLIHDSRPVDDADQENLRDMMECGEYVGYLGYEHLAAEGEKYSNGFYIKTEPNWAKATVEVDDVRAWLLNKGVRTGFFFPAATDAPDYLDPQNARYAPKLAAAVRAWQALPNQSDLAGKTPKQAMQKWLREHAASFGLTDEEGNPNETGIEETAKIANWLPSGGAPKTPGS